MSIKPFQTHAIRDEAAMRANYEDAAMWRWFCDVFQEGRIRWCRANGVWLVSVDHKHVSTEPDFDKAI